MQMDKGTNGLKRLVGRKIDFMLHATAVRLSQERKNELYYECLDVVGKMEKSAAEYNYSINLEGMRDVLGSLSGSLFPFTEYDNASTVPDLLNKICAAFQLALKSVPDSVNEKQIWLRKLTQFTTHRDMLFVFMTQKSVPASHIVLSNKKVYRLKHHPMVKQYHAQYYDILLSKMNGKSIDEVISYVFLYFKILDFAMKYAPGTSTVQIENQTLPLFDFVHLKSIKHLVHGRSDSFVSFLDIPISGPLAEENRRLNAKYHRMQTEEYKKVRNFLKKVILKYWDSVFRKNFNKLSQNKDMLESIRQNGVHHLYLQVKQILSKVILDHNIQIGGTDKSLYEDSPIFKMCEYIEANGYETPFDSSMNSKWLCEAEDVKKVFENIFNPSAARRVTPEVATEISSDWIDGFAVSVLDLDFDTAAALDTHGVRNVVERRVSFRHQLIVCEDSSQFDRFQNLQTPVILIERKLTGSLVHKVNAEAYRVGIDTNSFIKDVQIRNSDVGSADKCCEVVSTTVTLVEFTPIVSEGNALICACVFLMMHIR